MIVVSIGISDLLNLTYLFFILVLRIGKILMTIDKFDRQVNLYGSVLAIINLIKLAIIILLTAHIIACVFY